MSATPAPGGRAPVKASRWPSCSERSSWSSWTPPWSTSRCLISRPACASPPTSLSWVMNGYTLTFGGLLLLGGRAGDILGRRRMFLAGIVIFTLASLRRRPRTERWRAARRPRRPGRRRRARLAGRPRARGQRLPRGQGTNPGPGHLLGRGDRRQLARPRSRRHDHPVGELALGAVHQRADRHRGHHPRPDVRGRDAAPAGPLRPAGGRHLDRRRRGAGLRLHPRRLQRLG